LRNATTQRHLELLVLNDNSSSSGASWFALHVKRRNEKVIADILGNKGFEHFVPLYERQSSWRGRPVVLQCALFPGYVFCRFNPFERQVPIMTTPGVLRIVGYGNRPAAIDHEEIEALQTVTRAGLAAEPFPYLTCGTRVRIQRGVLEGVEGLLLSVKNQDRLLLSITLLQRSIALEIERSCVIPLEPAAVRQELGSPHETVAVPAAQIYPSGMSSGLDLAQWRQSDMNPDREEHGRTTSSLHPPRARAAVA
jgi:transcription antitermination factor NusG